MIGAKRQERKEKDEGIGVEIKTEIASEERRKIARQRAKDIPSSSRYSEGRSNDPFMMRVLFLSSVTLDKKGMRKTKNHVWS